MQTLDGEISHLYKILEDMSVILSVFSYEALGDAQIEAISIIEKKDFEMTE